MRFTITKRETVYYRLTVEAEDEATAIEIITNEEHDLEWRECTDTDGETEGESELVSVREAV